VQAFYALGLVEESSQHNAKAIEYFQEYLNRAVDLPTLSKEKVQAKLKRLSSAPSTEIPLKPVGTNPSPSSPKTGRLPLQ
jgi:hypothetical protein